MYYVSLNITGLETAKHRQTPALTFVETRQLHFMFNRYFFLKANISRFALKLLQAIQAITLLHLM